MLHQLIKWKVHVASRILYFMCKHKKNGVM